MSHKKVTKVVWYILVQFKAYAASVSLELSRNLLCENNQESKSLLLGSWIEEI
jgi:hypothetical protein